MKKEGGVRIIKILSFIKFRENEEKTEEREIN